MSGLEANGARALPPIAQDAWRAYSAMLDSKRAHYAYLEALDLKYRNGGVRTLAELARLETLLATHDLCVARFARLIKELAATNIAARNRLLEVMREVGEVDTIVDH